MVAESDSHAHTLPNGMRDATARAGHSAMYDLRNARDDMRDVATGSHHGHETENSLDGLHAFHKKEEPISVAKDNRIVAEFFFAFHMIAGLDPAFVQKKEFKIENKMLRISPEAMFRLLYGMGHTVTRQSVDQFMAHVCGKPEIQYRCFPKEEKEKKKKKKHGAKHTHDDHVEGQAHFDKGFGANLAASDAHDTDKTQYTDEVKQNCLSKLKKKQADKKKDLPVYGMDFCTFVTLFAKYQERGDRFMDLPYYHRHLDMDINGDWFHGRMLFSILFAFTTYSYTGTWVYELSLQVADSVPAGNFQSYLQNLVYVAFFYIALAFMLLFLIWNREMKWRYMSVMPALYWAYGCSIVVINTINQNKKNDDEYGGAYGALNVVILIGSILLLVAAVPPIIWLAMGRIKPFTKGLYEPYKPYWLVRKESYRHWIEAAVDTYRHVPLYRQYWELTKGISGASYLATVKEACGTICNWGQMKHERAHLKQSLNHLKKDEAGGDTCLDKVDDVQLPPVKMEKDGLPELSPVFLPQSMIWAFYNMGFSVVVIATFAICFTIDAEGGLHESADKLLAFPYTEEEVQFLADLVGDSFQAVYDFLLAAHEASFYYRIGVALKNLANVWTYCSFSSLSVAFVVGMINCPMIIMGYWGHVRRLRVLQQDLAWFSLYKNIGAAKFYGSAISCAVVGFLLAWVVLLLITLFFAWKDIREAYNWGEWFLTWLLFYMLNTVIIQKILLGKLLSWKTRIQKHNMYDVIFTNSVVLGLFTSSTAALMRLLYLLLFSIIKVPRMDICMFKDNSKFRKFDSPFKAFWCTLIRYEIANNPVVDVFSDVVLAHLMYTKEEPEQKWKKIYYKKELEKVRPQPQLNRNVVETPIFLPDGALASTKRRLLATQPFMKTFIHKAPVPGPADTVHKDVAKVAPHEFSEFPPKAIADDFSVIDPMDGNHLSPELSILEASATPNSTMDTPPSTPRPRSPYQSTLPSRNGVTFEPNPTPNRRTEYTTV